MKQKLLLAIALVSFLTSNAQITKLKEINDSGTSSSLPANLFVFNGKIYFAADDSNGSNSPGGADLGKELWVTDGTEAGTTFVKDLREGSSSSSPSFFFNFNNTLYFSANTGSGNVLFSSDETAAGTVATGGGFVFNPLELDGLIYYINTADSNALYTFDGTTQAKVANSGTEDVNFIGANFTSLNGKIIGYGRTTTDDPTIGTELYEYDLATDTYTLIKDIDTGTGDSSISNFVTIGAEVYFEADGKVWKTDGTTAGTVAVSTADTIGITSSYFVWNGNLYFDGDDGTGDQLWKYNPTADTVSKLSTNTGDHNPSDYAVLGDYLYYSADADGSTANYLFRTNGTTVEQVDTTIKDIDEVTVLNGKLYFEGDDGVSGNELYTVDTTTLAVDSNELEIVKVFPNPTSNYINIPTKLLNSNYSIYSILGKRVQRGKVTSEQISITKLSKGSYILKLEVDKTVITRKIIKQ